MIDLHMHSIFSDGSKTPEELVDEAVALGLQGIALTDHDTVAGIPRFLAAAEAAGIRAVSGVEVSAEIERGALHVLGYGVDHRDPAFNRQLDWIRTGREERNLDILQKLNRLNMRITLDDVKSFAGADVIGRPHFAQALIAKGYVHDKREAFDRYLGKGKLAYAERRRLDIPATMELIRSAGGVPVVAHPFTLRRTPRELKKLLARFKESGLVGLEVYYSEHSPEKRRAYKTMAQDLGLLATGGSDYHGAMSPGISMGKGPGNLNVPDSVWDDLQAALERMKR